MVSDFPDYQPGVGEAYAWQIARWVRANHRALGVTYVIYVATIWSFERDSEDWRPYRGLGGSSDTIITTATSTSASTVAGAEVLAKSTGATRRHDG